MKVKPRLPLCQIYCENNLEFTVYGLFDGSIIEFNETIVKDPDILQQYVNLC